MFIAPVCTRSIPNVCHSTTSINIRKPLRWQNRHAHAASVSKGTGCHFKAKRAASAAVCSSAEDLPHSKNKPQPEQKLTPEHAAAVSCTSLALLFPVLLSHGGNGNDGGKSGGGGGGGGGDGDGTGGNAQGDSGRNVIADIAEGSSEDDEEEDEDDEEDEDEEDEEEVRCKPSLLPCIVSSSCYCLPTFM